MKKILYSVLVSVALSSVLFFAGCKKSTPVNGLVHSYSESYTSGGTTTTTTTTLSYDAQSRLIEVQAGANAPITFVYTSGEVTQSQGTTTPIIYYLNSQGLITTDNQGNSYVFTNGYLTTETNTAAGTSTVNTVTNGNVTNVAATTAGSTTNYAYQFTSTVDYRNFGQAFYGKNDVDLILSYTVNLPTTASYNYSYTYDSKGRVITQTSNSGITSDVYTYTYVNP